MSRNGLIERAKQRARRIAAETRAIFSGLAHGGDSADVFGRLRAHHDELERLLDVIRQEPSEERRHEVVDQLRAELLLHGHLEEYVVYPALRALPEVQFLVEQSQDEHAAVEELADELHHGTEDWDERYEQLRLLVLDHVRREETELFPAAEAALSHAQARGLAETFDFEMRNRRQFFEELSSPPAR